jgi:hypothetical protein
MNRPRHYGSHIPLQPNNSQLGSMRTSGTLPGVGTTAAAGTDAATPQGYEFVDLPARTSQPQHSDKPYWTIEKVVGFGAGGISLVAVLVAAVIFFVNMGRDVSDIKSNVKDQGTAIGQLNEQTQKNAFNIERATDAINNLASDVKSDQSSRRK